MYAIIHKNQVLVGPKERDKAFFTYSIDKIGITEFLLPISVPETFPIKVNEDTSIHKVTVVEDSFNKMTQYLRGPLFEITPNEVIARYEVIDQEIEFARNNFKEQASLERRKKEESGTKVTLHDTAYAVSTTRVERDIFAINAALLNETDTINFKFKEGFVQLKKSDLLTISNAIRVHVQSAFDWEADIIAQIDSAQTAEELLAIEIIKEDKPMRAE